MLQHNALSHRKITIKLIYLRHSYCASCLAMSEMLGNFYFHQRKFLSAQRQLEQSLKFNSSDSIKKKLIICYTQSGLLCEAIKMLHDLINRDINLITKTNIKEENCPCADLIYEIENSPNFTRDDYEQMLMLGILWLYCDIYKSKFYFSLACELNQSDNLVLKIFSMISNCVNNNLNNNSQS